MLDLWVSKIPWRRAWQPTLVFLSGESHGQRSIGGYSSGSLQLVGRGHSAVKVLGEGWQVVMRGNSLCVILVVATAHLAERNACDTVAKSSLGT